MIKDDRPVLWPGSLRKSKCSILLLGAMLAVLPIKSMVRENHRDVPWDSNPIYVYCLVQNQWVNGQVENLADVELRDGKTSGPVIDGAEVPLSPPLPLQWEYSENSMHRGPTRVERRRGATVS